MLGRAAKIGAAVARYAITIISLCATTAGAWWCVAYPAASAGTCTRNCAAGTSAATAVLMAMAIGVAALETCTEHEAEAATATAKRTSRKMRPVLAHSPGPHRMCQTPQGGNLANDAARRCP
jgi:hypothetical protein